MFEGCKTLVVLDGWMGGSNMMISLFVVVVMVWPMCEARNKNEVSHLTLCLDVVDITTRTGDDRQLGVL